MASQFAKNDHRVFYISTGFIQGPSYKYFSKGKNIYQVQLAGTPEVNIYTDEIKDYVEELYQSFEQLIAEKEIRNAVLLVQLPFWKDLALALREKYRFKVVYDCMDKHSGFSTNKNSMLNQEEDLSKQSDLVITTSLDLFNEHRKLNKNCILNNNATNFNHFCSPINGIAGQIAHLPPPIIGYYGAISDWFDTQLVAEMAKKQTNWTFVLIGSTFGADLSPLAGINNIKLLGEQSYASLPGFLHAFDVCIIPFKVLPLTNATNPVKFFEYLSAGKPVVSVALPELLPYEQEELVYIAGDSEQFIEKIKQALDTNSHTRRVARMNFAQKHTWEARFLEISLALQGLYKKVSIVIITYNNLHLTQLCLESIFKCTHYPNYELIIVDNHSFDGTVKYLKDLKKKRSDVKIKLNNRNEGFAKANNQGMQMAEGEYIVLLNNDTIVTSHWLTKLIGYLEKYSEVGMVGPVTNCSGNESKIDVTYTSIEDIEEFARQYTEDHEGCFFEIKMLAMFCVAFRRTLLDEVGLLDEQFGIGMFEDDDFALRVKERGYKLICAEDIFVHHFLNASFKLLGQQKYLEIFQENKKKFEKKWGISWQPHCYREK